ncbi:MAG: hypothetical protein FJ217_13610 [Ignavibacteria bacterium]|nr:hypothetical protein [Ignavibacteria bacterium]
MDHTIRVLVGLSFLLSVFCFLFLSDTLYAQDYWQQTNGPYGGDVLSLAVSASGNVFAGTRGGGVFLSTDNGTSWTQVNTGLTNTSVWALAVGGTNLFAGTLGGGVFLSTDNGTSWSAANTGLTNTTVMAFAVSGLNLFAGTLGRGVWRSVLLTLPPAPTLISPADGASNLSTAPLLTWSQVSGAVKYHLQVSSSPSFLTMVVNDSTLTSTSRQLGSLAHGTKYYWRVRAKNEAGYGQYSVTMEFHDRSAHLATDIYNLGVREEFHQPDS